MEGMLSRVKMASMQARLCGLMAIGLAGSIVGCSAPLGPIGGAHWGSVLTPHCHCCVSGGTCDQDDPLIIPPHANFHPLPTRPVFSPPSAIPGIYVPWPDSNPLPASGAATPPPGTDVQAPRHLDESQGELAKVPAPAANEPAANSTGQPLLLRR
jgi:hypothetical protein